MTDFNGLGGMTALAIANSKISQDAGATIKGTYGPLRDLVATWANNDVEALEITPLSTARRAVIEETIDSLSPIQRALVLDELQKFVIAAIDENEPTIVQDPAWQELLKGFKSLDVGPSIGSVISGSGNVIRGDSNIGVAPPTPWPQPGRPR